MTRVFLKTVNGASSAPDPCEPSVFIAKDRGVRFPFTSIRCANLSNFTRAKKTLELVSQFIQILFQFLRYFDILLSF